MVIFSPLPLLLKVIFIYWSQTAYTVRVIPVPGWLMVALWLYAIGPVELVAHPVKVYPVLVKPFDAIGTLLGYIAYVLLVIPPLEPFPL